MAVVEITSWRDLAACRDNPGPFFDPEVESDDARRAREQVAKAICADCRVLSDCRADIDARPNRFGIYAGETGAERSTRRRNERRRARPAALAQAQRRAS